MKIQLMDGTITEVQLENNENIANEEVILASNTKWLNKDRIWTLVFWFGMSTGLGLGPFFRFALAEPYLSSIINRVTLLGVPLIVTLASRTRFIKKDTFINNEGKLITEKQMPYSFPLATIAGVGVTFVLVEKILPEYQPGSFLGSFIFFSCLLSGLSLYFILKNCPISILFNYKFWTVQFRPGSFGRRSYESSSSSSNSSKDYYYSPTYSSSMSNTHYNSHRHR